MKKIEQKYFDLFYANTSTNRWMELFIFYIKNQLDNKFSM